MAVSGLVEGLAAVLADVPFLSHIRRGVEISETDIAQMMAARTRITALAVTEKDIFVCVTGNGYEVWRSNHDFQEPTKVLDRLSGCCGQMDIQASGDQLFVAANTKFQVAVHDRDGVPVSSFGKRDRRPSMGSAAVATR